MKREAILSCGLTDEQLADPKVRETLRVPLACRAVLSQVCCYNCPNVTLFVPRDDTHIYIVPDEYERGNANSNLLGC